jgi:hypothetical protein
VTREEKIMKRMREHYERGVELYGESRIVGLFLQGSQNYGLDYENSDIDTKLIITPTLEDIIFNRKPVSTTHVMENEEHLDAKDIRLYIQTFRKQNLNFLEILFTEFKIVNPQYEKMWNVLVEHREEIARYNEFQAIKSMKGIAMEKYHAMEHPYPSKVDIINTYGYDGKQVHHLLRVEDYIERYIAGESYESCLIPTPNKVLHMMEYKRQEIPYEIAKKEADDAIAHVTEMADVFAASVENIGKPSVDEILNQVQRDIMKFAIATELAEDEYYD